MPRSLVSYWKRVAVSGPTADGREITVQELVDCAETYSLSRYTATIWSEHEREPGGHGTVYSVRLIDDDPELETGQVALEAQLKPNDDLLYLNDRGKKLFTSVEITPNFANSGRFYLTGLAVTDSPASLGTQELYFSKRSNATAYYTDSLPIGSLRDNGPGRQDMGGFFAALAGLCKRFSDSVSTTPATPSPDEKKPMDEATAKALKALMEQMVIVIAGIQAVLEPVAEEVDTSDSQEQLEAVGAAVQDIVDQADEDRTEFKRKDNKELSTRIGELEATMTKLMSTGARRGIPRSTGPAGQSQRKKGLR